MNSYRSTLPKRKSGRRKWLLLAAVILAGVGVWFAFLRGSAPEVKHGAAQSASKAKTENNESAPKPELINLQPTVDSWLANQKGDFGIIVYDPDNKQVIAKHDTDVQFFTASIYKFYAVYLSLEDVQKGKHTLSEDFRFGKTRQQCLHDAIHTSDSPCAEALLNEIGQAEVTQRLKDYGLTGTSFPAFVTTAQDSMIMLQRLYDKRDLTEASANLMLDAMKTQVYRDGLAKGMPDAAVATKVGFSETPHYHELGIATLPNGRKYLVAFFSKGVNSKVVADFGATIEAALK